MNVLPNVLGPLIATVSYFGFSTAFRNSFWNGSSFIENLFYTQSGETAWGSLDIRLGRGPQTLDTQVDRYGLHSLRSTPRSNSSPRSRLISETASGSMSAEGCKFARFVLTGLG